MSRALCCFLAFGSLIPLGCGGGERLAPVAGKVYVNSVPLEGGPRSYVVFQPDRSKKNDSPHEPKAVIQKDGSYLITTVDREGATPGWYRVRVDAAEVVDPKNPYFTKWLVPEKYADFVKSGLVVEVVEQPPAGAYDLQIKK
jgi:hypothetical protein